MPRRGGAYITQQVFFCQALWHNLLANKLFTKALLYISAHKELLGNSAIGDLPAPDIH